MCQPGLLRDWWGAVFSVGSIRWVGGFAWNDYDNNAARVSDNVLNEFLRREHAVSKGWGLRS